MRSVYGSPVFDEWMILTQGGESGGVPAYEGPRSETFRRQLVTDAAPLRALTENSSLEIGDFEFAQEATGSRHDVVMRVGAASYLVCNHTAKSMAEIRADPRWRKAQAAFFELSEKFRGDPLAENKKG